jgi:hypothetical protein
MFKAPIEVQQLLPAQLLPEKWQLPLAAVGVAAWQLRGPTAVWAAAINRLRCGCLAAQSPHRSVGCCYQPPSAT